MLGYLIARASLKDLPELPLTGDQILAAAAAVNLVLVLIAIAVMPGGGECAGQGELELRRLHRAGRRHCRNRSGGHFRDPRPVRPHHLSNSKASRKKRLERAQTITRQPLAILAYGWRRHCRPSRTAAISGYR